MARARLFARAEWRPIAAGVAPLATAYLVTALVGLACLALARRSLEPDELRALLGFLFIAALSSGLEPATSRARALADRAPPRVAPVLAASALKALAATPPLAIVWRLADPAVSIPLLFAGLAPTILAGFWASELRVRLDLRGRHPAALWIKQGSLALAFAGATAGSLAGWSPPAWLALAAAPRLILALAAASRMARPGDGQAGIRDLLADRGWIAMALTSALAAVGGSADRLAALSLLAPAAVAGYALLYELLSRFWVLPYLAAPVLFARAAGGTRSEDLRRAVRLATLSAGAVLVAAVALASAFAAKPLRETLGLPLGGPAIAFAVAIVAGAMTQLIVAELQGCGAVRRAGLVVGLGAVLAPPLFWGFARVSGVTGLLLAWPVKSAMELALAHAFERGWGGSRAALP